MGFFSKAKAALNVAIHIIDRVHEVASEKGYLPPVVEKAWTGYRETVSDWVGAALPDEPEEWEGDSIPRRPQAPPQAPPEEWKGEDMEEPAPAPQAPPQAPWVPSREDEREDDPLRAIGRTSDEWLPTDNEGYFQSPEIGKLPEFPPPVDGSYLLVAEVPGIGPRSMTLRGTWEQVMKDLAYFVRRAMERPMSGGPAENIPAWTWFCRVFSE